MLLFHVIFPSQQRIENENNQPPQNNGYPLVGQQTSGFSPLPNTGGYVPPPPQQQQQQPWQTGAVTTTNTYSPLQPQNTSYPSLNQNSFSSPPYQQQQQQIASPYTNTNTPTGNTYQSYQSPVGYPQSQQQQYGTGSLDNGGFNNGGFNTGGLNNGGLGSGGGYNSGGFNGGLGSGGLNGGLGSAGLNGGGGGLYGTGSATPGGQYNNGGYNNGGLSNGGMGQPQYGNTPNNNFYIPANFGQTTTTTNPTNNNSMFQPQHPKHAPVDATTLLKGTQVRRVECPVCQKMIEGDDMAVNHHVNEHYT
ncbi:uncharacterized protein EV154DRAFT_571134 [Mucor mucedo]|uniref:uncharacterized protein n=1 Tax=Mucor mucedo TaxID=29922 RepID=UPI0022210769|nr:uncharacterized protein EV154DRAFT_571134 [Mucor mucedo]KAI7869611.1 hypothetical protein EV154DRAFT_571134 [Mucor mucedo]